MPRWKRPHWWDWELELSEHVLERMVERGAHELALRWMLHRCLGLRRSRGTGRHIALSRYRGQLWEIVLEPDHERERIVVITMYNV